MYALNKYMEGQLGILGWREGWLDGGTEGWMEELGDTGMQRGLVGWRDGWRGSGMDGVMVE